MCVPCGPYRIEPEPIDSDEPRQNSTGKLFNGKVREGCLSIEWFHCHTEARDVIGTRCRHYKHARPESSLQVLPQSNFTTKLAPIAARKGRGGERG
jgi:hypothetical protein